jgi:hypothetical protein
MLQLPSVIDTNVIDTEWISKLRYMDTMEYDTPVGINKLHYRK